MSEKSLKRFMFFAAGVATLIGLNLLLLPDVMMETNGLTVSDTARLFARSVGGMLLGVAVMTAMAANDQGSPAFWGVVLGNLVIHVIGLGIDGIAIMANIISENPWFSLIVHGFFTIAFGYIYLRRSQILSAE